MPESARARMQILWIERVEDAIAQALETQLVSK